MRNQIDKYYFISDVHLGFFEREVNREKENIFINCLDYISKDAKIIFLLGDIFDYWFEWKSVIPRYYYRVLSKLYDLKISGIEIVYLMGNHDFGHNDFFETELGIKIYKNEYIASIDSKKFFLHHGDGLIKGDIGYKILKKITRNKTNQKLYTKLLHPNFAIKLASHSSKKSRNYSNKISNNENNELYNFAKTKIEEGFDYVILGHKHLKEHIKYKNGEYINLGDWFKEPNIGVYFNDNFSFINNSELIKV